jgi:hypothetical protein
MVSLGFRPEIQPHEQGFEKTLHGMKLLPEPGSGTSFKGLLVSFVWYPFLQI